ncbi:MAG: hypothetical protein ABIL25_07100 [candidate division WOR-3 bacterium]
MSDDRLRILKMLEEKKITAEEAAKLLDAIKSADADSQKNRFLKVKVWERGLDRPKVNITLPLGLVKWGLKMAPESAKARIAEHDVDLKVVSEALEKGITGKIVEVDEDEEGKHVEVWLE